MAAAFTGSEVKRGKTQTHTGFPLFVSHFTLFNLSGVRTQGCRTSRNSSEGGKGAEIRLPASSSEPIRLDQTQKKHAHPETQNPDIISTPVIQAGRLASVCRMTTCEACKQISFHRIQVTYATTFQRISTGGCRA